MLALLADLHANLEALEACLAHARAQGATRHALLGDFVGYGPDPGAVVDEVRRLAKGGARAVKGNHDEAVEGGGPYMNHSARASIAWTRGVLDEGQRRFLEALPLALRDDVGCFTHASADRPERWTSVDSPSAAARAIEAAGSAYAFCGHVHEQRLYFENSPGRVTAFRPTAGTSIPMPRHRRWLAIAGSVGQSRDGDARAAYALLDEERRRITFHRVPYDNRAVADKMERAGLPAALVYRMRHGA